MASYKCKKCKQKNTIPQNWIDLGINRIVVCENCSHKMNLNLGGVKPEQEAQGTQVTSGAQSNPFSGGGTSVNGIKQSKVSKYYLEVITKINKGEKHAINLQESYTIFIGRNPATKVKLLEDNSPAKNNMFWIVSDAYVSRLQCQVEVMVANNKIQFVIKDSNSANGTKINNNVIESDDEILLHLGDEVHIGNTMFTLKKE